MFFLLQQVIICIFYDTHKWYMYHCHDTNLFGTNENGCKWAGDGLVVSISVLFVTFGIYVSFQWQPSLLLVSRYVGLIVGTSNSADVFGVTLQWQRELSHLIPCSGAGANQPVHWFPEGKGLGIQQGSSVWVGLSKSSLGVHSFCFVTCITNVGVKRGVGWGIVLPLC